MIDMPREPSHPERLPSAVEQTPTHRLLTGPDIDQAELIQPENLPRARREEPTPIAVRIEPPRCDSTPPIPPQPPERPPFDDIPSLTDFLGLEADDRAAPDTPDVDCDTVPSQPVIPGEIDTTSERAEIISPKTAYDIARQALISCGEYRRDAHYAFGEVAIDTDEGKVAGTGIKLTDYHSFESREFQVGEEGWAADPEEQARLLEISKAIINVSLYPKIEGQVTSGALSHLPYYDFVELSNVRPDYGWEELLRDPRQSEQGVRLSDYPVGEFVVVKNSKNIMHDNEIQNDPQLVKIIGALRKMIEEAGEQ